jgi:hypothetical protein
MPYDDPLGDARAKVVFPSRMDPAGQSGPTRGQAQGRYWRRTSRGLFIPSSVDGSGVEQRIAEAAAVLPEVGGVTGWAGLRWAGAVWLDGSTPDPSHVLDVDLATCYQDIRSQDGFRVWQERLSPIELTALDGVSITLPVRSLFFCMRYARSVREAVKYADLAAYSDVCSIEEARIYALSHPGWTGVPQARKALLLADENSWSPKETDFRMIWILDAGLSHPLCNQPIFDRQGRHIGTPDLLDLESGTMGEYDGVLHLEGSRRSRDSRRQEKFRNHGLEPFHVVGHDMADRELVAERIHAARRRAKWEAESQRAWTIEPPPWWRETRTVDQRRALDLEDKERLLGHRRWAS